MIVKAICEKCGYEYDLEMKLMEIIICPKCKTVYSALKAERIIRSKIDRSYINKTAVITLDKESEK